MGRFLEEEKIRQIQFKADSDFISEDAREDGFYSTKLRPFCLPVAFGDQNLYPGIRESAMSFFFDNRILWHDGQGGLPSNHMCDSQVACVNFLFSFVHRPDALAQLFQPLFPSINRVLPVEKDHFVSFEWIGQENYLGERIRKGATRTRGANFTSADAIVKFEQDDAKIRVVLIEWKYTESYSDQYKRFSKHGTDRGMIYRHLYDQPDCPINKDRLPDYDDLFYEPFYQLMRQQLLAHEMEKAGELDADMVSLLHIAPAHNCDFPRVTSPGLRELGESVTEVWKKLVIPVDRFDSISTEALFSRFEAEEMQDWHDYIQQRYPWIVG